MSVILAILTLATSPLRILAPCYNKAFDFGHMTTQMWHKASTKMTVGCATACATACSKEASQPLMRRRWCKFRTLAGLAHDV